MKVLEILTEAKNLSFGEMQKKIYSYILSKVKTDEETKYAIKDQMFETDRFWTDAFDLVSDEIDNSTADNGYVDGITDAIAQSIEGVISNIDDYFHDSMNHAPGYKKPKITWPAGFQEGNIPKKDMDALVKEIAGAEVEKAAQAMKDWKLSQAEKQKAASKGITPEHLAAAAKLIKEWSDKGFAALFKEIKKDAKNFKGGKFWSWKDVCSVEDLEKLDDAMAFKKHVLANSKLAKSAKGLIELESNNIEFAMSPAQQKKNKDALATLATVSRDPALSKKLAAQIK